VFVSFVASLVTLYRNSFTRGAAFLSIISSFFAAAFALIAFLLDAYLTITIRNRATANTNGRVTFQWGNAVRLDPVI
jgi:hypothetical protein